MNAEYDFVIIGGGPGGYEAALRAAELGFRAAIVEKRDLGGTCVNRGCIPTKTLLHAAGLITGARETVKYGVKIDAGQIDMGALYAKKDAVVSELRRGISDLMEAAGVDVYRGTGKILADHAVEITAVDAAQNVADKTVIIGKHIIIASGCVPSKPPIKGIDLPCVLNSDRILDEQGKKYRSLVMIGGGVIGIEFADFYRQMDCKVTILEGMNRLLPNMDPDFGQNLKNILRKKGVKIVTGARVDEIRESAEGAQVHYCVDGREEIAEAEAVICAVGRSPDLTGMFGSGLEPEMNRRQLKVDEQYQTSIPGVYAIGDVSARIQLEHVAAAQGRRCVELIAGKVPTVSEEEIPVCVYCTPEIASVGISAKEAAAIGVAAEDGKALLFSNARTMISQAPRSFVKITASCSTREILGARLMCSRATDIISEFTEAIRNHITVEQMLSYIRPHPTYEEAVVNALRDLQKKLEPVSSGHEDETRVF